MVKINGSQVKRKLDRGATTNVLSTKTYIQLGSNAMIIPSSVILNAFGGSKVKHEGSTMLQVEVNNDKIDSKFYITSRPRGLKVQPILGLPAREELGLVTRTKNVSVIKSKNAINKQIYVINIRMYLKVLVY